MIQWLISLFAGQFWGALGGFVLSALRDAQQRKMGRLEQKLEATKVKIDEIRKVQIAREVVLRRADDDPDRVRDADEDQRGAP